MNTYEITFTRENGSTGKDRITAANEKQARKDFREIHRHSSATITDVIVAAENVPASKQQERDALDQIRAIVDTLGPDSYLATAFAGCFEDAEENIKNDFACSMKQRLESAEAKRIEAELGYNRLVDKLAASEKALEAARADIEKKDEEIAALNARISAIQRPTEPAEISDELLADLARDFAAEIRDGIGWTIVYRTGRSWNALTIWSDIWNGEWETNDLNDAIGILKADPDAVIVNGYYCGHFGEDMTIDEIADGIRWHYEGGRNRLTDYCEVTQGRDALEEGRKAAEAAGLPFCERLADGGDDELSPYVYDGSMTLADREKMQQAREAFEKLADALREIAAKLAEALKPVINAVLSALKKLWKVSAKAIGVPPKWLHLAAHAKKARTRKKYRNRIRRYVFEALAAEGGGGP